MLSGNILTTDGWIHGRLHIHEGRIVALEGDHADPASNDDPYILPGFLDLHVHGGGGADVMEGAAAVATMTRLHARHGTTGLLATTMTAPHEKLVHVLGELGAIAHTRAPGGARVLGIHLEGPYINPNRLGAQPDAAVVAVLDEVLAYMKLAPVRIVTLAPEIAGHMEIISQLAARGVRVQLGHTVGSYDDGVKALKHGASGFTTCSMRCHPCIIGNPAWSARHWHMPTMRRLFPICCTCIPARFTRLHGPFRASMLSPTVPLPLACPMANTGLEAST